MTQTTRVSLVAALCAIVTACGGSEKKTETAADVAAAEAPAGKFVRVLDSGQEPRAARRYKIAPGTSGASEMVFQITSLAATTKGAAVAVTPSVRLKIASGPSMESTTGSRYDVRIVKASALVPEGLPDDVARDLQQGVSVLNNVGGWVDVNDRGIIQASELNTAATNPDVPARLLVMLANARSTLARVPLPDEAVGLGARWEVQKRVVLYGVEIAQVDTYTLVEDNGDTMRLNVSVQQTATRQDVVFPNAGVEVTVRGFRMSAQGESIVDLNALTTSAAATGSSLAQLLVSSESDAEIVEVDRAFEMTIKPLAQ